MAEYIKRVQEKTQEASHCHGHIHNYFSFTTQLPPSRLRFSGRSEWPVTGGWSFNPSVSLMMLADFKCDCNGMRGSGGGGGHSTEFYTGRLRGPNPYPVIHHF